MYSGERGDAKSIDRTKANAIHLGFTYLVPSDVPARDISIFAWGTLRDSIKGKEASRGI